MDTTKDNRTTFKLIKFTKVSKLKSANLSKHVWEQLPQTFTARTFSGTQKYSYNEKQKALMTNGSEAASFGATPREVARNINNKLRELLEKHFEGTLGTTAWYDPDQITYNESTKSFVWGPAIEFEGPVSFLDFLECYLKVRDCTSYFPEITMTYNSTSLMKKIYNHTSKLKNSDPKVRYVITNMDFNKWNSHMRKKETHLHFQDFDHLFGFSNCFTRTHGLFQIFIYLANNVLILHIDPVTGMLQESEIVWSDHLGGLEGLRQKG